MRLLNTSTLKLRNFDGDEAIPFYAILSHTWGSSEVTFRDLSDNPGSSEVAQKMGYQKLVGFCTEACRQGFEWAWADTCCIDKSSSAELSEAINSMFRWYQNAISCFVYLADWPHGPSSGLDPTSWSSRWFTRAWTLQELLAPRNVLFYSSAWVEIGSKKTLAPQISQVASIDVDVLLNKRSVREFSVAQRMSWAARRQATRREDIAYSLLGIFGIHMPLLYGEGDTAFARLQQEIIRSEDDHTIFAWKALPDVVADQAQAPVLAFSPLAFRSASRIVKTPKSNLDTVTEVEYAITNLGLRIDLPVVHDPHLSDRGFWGVLQCHSLDDPRYQIALQLEQVFEGRFSRVGSAMVHLQSLQPGQRIFCQRRSPEVL